MLRHAPMKLRKARISKKIGLGETKVYQILAESKGNTK